MSSPSTAGPTVVLVHGAFADASSWSRVVTQLQEAGVATEAVVNPLRGLTADGEYVASVLDQIDGDIVLVGHSYGGPVITYASSKADNVKALVYVASFGLDQGMSALDSVEGFPASNIGPSLRPRAYPGYGGEPGTELYIDPDLFSARGARERRSGRGPAEPPDHWLLLFLSAEHIGLTDGFRAPRAY
jgi:pimeloyl-ACP methyl ester carboxylesterase